MTITLKEPGIKVSAYIKTENNMNTECEFWIIGNEVICLDFDEVFGELIDGEISYYPGLSGPDISEFEKIAN